MQAPAGHTAAYVGVKSKLQQALLAPPNLLHSLPVLFSAPAFPPGIVVTGDPVGLLSPGA